MCAVQAQAHVMSDVQELQDEWGLTRTRARALLAQHSGDRRKAIQSLVEVPAPNTPTRTCLPLLACPECPCGQDMDTQDVNLADPQGAHGTETEFDIARMLASEELEVSL